MWEVKVIIQDLDWNEISQFPWHQHKSIAQMAEDNWVEIPVSCCAGACFVCAAQIKKWHDDIDIGKLGIPLVDIEQDEETWKYKEMLTCIGWIKAWCFTDDQYHEIVLQKLI